MTATLLMLFGPLAVRVCGDVVAWVESLPTAEQRLQRAFVVEAMRMAQSEALHSYMDVRTRQRYAADAITQLAVNWSTCAPLSVLRAAADYIAEWEAVRAGAMHHPEEDAHGA